jgi:hypothetical protein
VLDAPRNRLVRGTGSAVEVRDLGGGLAWSAETGGPVEHVTVDPETGRVAALVRGAWNEAERSYRPTARVWEADGEPRAVVEGAYAVAFLPGAVRLATGGRWGTVWLWELVPR